MTAIVVHDHIFTVRNKTTISPKDYLKFKEYCKQIDISENNEIEIIK